jgi:hypothetical protein
MKYRNIFWGVILILVGILFTLENLNLIYFNVRELWRLWPVILILWGISIVPADKWIRIGLVLVVLAGSVFFMLDRAVEWENDHDYVFEWNDDQDRYEKEEYVGNQQFDIAYEDSTEFATLNMEAAAGSFILLDTTSSLLRFSQNKSSIRYEYFAKKVGDRVKVNIEAANGRSSFGNKSDGKVSLELNTKPLWDINLEVGAAQLKFDLSPYQIRKLKLESGAASLNLRFGDKYPETKVNVEAGASKIVIEIPKESGCDLEVSAVFSGKRIEGFEKIDHGHYQTPNFSTADNKVYLDVNAAVSSYSIIRY